jgi:hypothetical protein
MTVHIGRVVGAAVRVKTCPLGYGVFTSDLTHDDSRNETENSLRTLLVQIDLARK